MPDHKDDDGDLGVLTKPKIKPKLEQPKMYSVLFVNDDYTPMEFVVLVIVKFLNLDLDDATRFTLKVHQEGRGQLGRYTHDVAETKCAEIVGFARENLHPLTVEPVEAD
jgi:ATP-dependent Clp protease adaptor protein ClpS